RLPEACALRLEQAPAVRVLICADARGVRQRARLPAGGPGGAIRYTDWLAGRICADVRGRRTLHASAGQQIERTSGPPTTTNRKGRFFLWRFGKPGWRRP